MKKYIDLHGTLLSYELTWKKVKNFNMRIHSDRGVLISAPKRVGISGVEDFIRRNEAFIFSSQKKLKENSSHMPLKGDFPNDGCVIPIFGRERTVKLLQGNDNRAFIEEAFLYVICEREDREWIKRIIRKHLEELSKETIPSVCRQGIKQLSEYSVEFPELRYRCMVSRWGSCCPSKKTVTFNKFLICAPMECIEYVVLHELVHFLVPNHSSDFYKILSEVMPDWKWRRKRLKAYGSLLRNL